VFAMEPSSERGRIEQFRPRLVKGESAVGGTARPRPFPGPDRGLAWRQKENAHVIGFRTRNGRRTAGLSYPRKRRERGRTAPAHGWRELRVRGARAGSRRLHGGPPHAGRQLRILGQRRLS